MSILWSADPGPVARGKRTFDGFTAGQRPGVSRDRMGVRSPRGTAPGSAETGWEFVHPGAPPGGQPRPDGSSFTRGIAPGSAETGWEFVHPGAPPRGQPRLDWVLRFSPMQHLYLHVPFCVRRCSYCDFSIAVRKRLPVAEYVNAVLREWRSADP